MDIFNSFIDRFLAMGPWWVLLISVVLIYGGMFLVTLIGESRILPMFAEDQSKTFCPGDLFLAVVVMQLCYVQMMSIPTLTWVHSERWALLVDLITTIHFVARRLITESALLPLRSRYSPSKIYRDLVEHFFFEFLILLRGIPALVVLIQSEKDYIVNWMIIFIAMGVFWVCVAYDKTLQKEKENLYSVEDSDIPLYYYVLQARYPSGWAPIWQTKKICR